MADRSPDRDIPIWLSGWAALSLLLGLGVIGVVVWAIVRVVLWLTGGGR